MQKQATNWGLALLITGLLAGIFYLLVGLVQGILTLILKDTPSDQIKAYARAIVTIPLLIFILIELYKV